MRTFKDSKHENTVLDTIGERIRSERLRKGWTQVKFASKLGLYVNHSRISKWENGNEIPGDDIVRMMAKVFECEYCYLKGEYPQRTRTEADIKQATGLSDKAVEAIKNADHYRGLPSMPSMKECSGNPKDMLDKLLQDVRFHDVLTQIGHYYNGILSLENHEAAFQEMQSSDPSDYENALATVYESGMVVIRPEGAAEHHLYLACEKLKEIVRDFSNKEKEARSENGKE